jgi:2-hydroxychromene-2-carboxylate isomerase
MSDGVAPAAGAGAAADRGAFGAPSFFVGDELFWGQDRLSFVEEALLALPA